MLYIAGGDSYGPYDKDFDYNHNGIIDEDEKTAESAYIRHMVEAEKLDSNESEEDDDDQEMFSGE